MNEFEEKLLGTIPADLNVVSNDDVVFSADGRNVAYVAERERKRVVMVNDTRGPEFDWSDRPVFSPDGKNVAYVGVTDIDWKVWLDWNTPNFERGGKWYVITDAKRLGPYDYAWLISFNPDGKRVAFAALKDKKWHVVNGDSIGESFDWVGVPHFGSDGRVAYTASSGNKSFMVVDKKRGSVFDEVGDPAWSPDGKKLVYAARRGNKWYAVVETTMSPAYDQVRSVWFSKRGSLSFIANRKGRAFAVVDGKDEERFDDIPGVVFSEDASAWGYAAKTGEQWIAVSGSKRGKPAKSVTGIAVSNGGDRLAYANYDSVYRVIIDEKILQETSDMPTGLRFTANGKNLAYILVGDENKAVGINGTSTQYFDDVRTFVISPDGKKIGVGARDGNQLWWKVLEVK